MPNYTPCEYPSSKLVILVLCDSVICALNLYETVHVVVEVLRRLSVRVDHAQAVAVLIIRIAYRVAVRLLHISRFFSLWVAIMTITPLRKSLHKLFVYIEWLPLGIRYSLRN